ncbi:MAG: NOP5/NOP56 family protein [Nitrososphaeria archaeon]
MNGELPEEVMKKIAEGNPSEVVVPNEAIADLLKSRAPGLKVRVDPAAISSLLSNKVELMINGGLVKDQQEALEVIRNYTIYLSEKKLKEQASRLDLHAIQIVQAIDELDRTINLFYMRLREWYGLHFPELYNVVNDPETYVNFVHNFPNREQIRSEKLEELNFPKKKAELIESLAESSKGAAFEENMSKLIDELASITLNLIKLRKEMTKELERIMKSIAPNMTALVGATIGARLLSKAGSLEKLAKMPASTIQVLGAEKALFRALRTKSKPPKHGIIFQHKLIHDAPKKLRGKLARALASKLAIAVRMDYYSGKKNDELIKSFYEKAEEIRKRFFEEQQKKGSSVSAKPRKV